MDVSLPWKLGTGPGRFRLRQSDGEDGMTIMGEFRRVKGWLYQDVFPQNVNAGGLIYVI